MSGGEIAAITVALVSLVGTVLGAILGYRAQTKNIEVNASLETRSIESATNAVAAELYDELVRNQADRIHHLETREKEMEARIQALGHELEETRMLLNNAMLELEQAHREINALKRRTGENDGN